MVRILVVEDNENTQILMEDVLKDNGYTTILAKDGIEALGILDKQHIDLVILDIMMPNMDGYEFAETLRRSGINIPILIVTAKDTPNDIKKGFLAGADDYMVKPIDMEEMILRIAAILRRAKIANERKLVIGSTTLNYDKLLVVDERGEWDLPQKEFLLLFKLLSYQGTIFTRAQLLDEIWGVDSQSDWHTIDVHISRLREKFKDSHDFDIVTVRGLGYKAVRKHV